MLRNNEWLLLTNVSKQPIGHISNNQERQEGICICWTAWPLKMGPIGCPETSVINNHSSLRNILEERDLRYIAAEALKPRLE